MDNKLGIFKIVNNHYYHRRLRLYGDGLRIIQYAIWPLQQTVLALVHVLSPTEIQWIREAGLCPMDDVQCETEEIQL